MIEYNKIWIFLCMCVLLVLVIFGLSIIVMYRNYNMEKISAYECGFQPFEDTRSRFDVKFYLEGIISMSIFLYILTIGFIYE
jgi:NADH-quinone oxidoreductase subunit A